MIQIIVGGIVGMSRDTPSRRQLKTLKNKDENFVGKGRFVVDAPGYDLLDICRIRNLL